MAITFDKPNQIILITAPQTEVTVHNLLRAIRDYEDSSVGMDIYKIAESLSPSFGSDIVERSLKTYESENRIPEKTYPEVAFIAKPAKSWAR